MAAVHSSVVLLVTIFIHLVIGQEVQTDYGAVKGKTIDVLGKDVVVFYGIPFARPPLGDLRFKPPQPAKPWGSEVKDVTKETPSCMQSLESFKIVKLGKEFQTPDDFSEDCLHLNIWKPASADSDSKLAVMVWIYGGGFGIGSSRVPLHNGQILAAENDVIVVSVNYRVGPLGFGYMGTEDLPGNMGLMDQLEGIKWVKNNIENFGGDSDRITLFGESAGATSIGYHLISPESHDWFNNAILESGSPFQSNMHSTTELAREHLKKLSEALECSGSDEHVHSCLSDTNAETITSVAHELSMTGVVFLPVLDGEFLPTDLKEWVKLGNHKKTNILTGATFDEITLFFYAFLDVESKKTGFTGHAFVESDMDLGVRITTGITDQKEIKYLRGFYESEQSPPRDYLQILNDLGSDVFFKCPIVLISDVYAETNDVYVYSLEYRLSNLAHPEWMGVPHGYEVPLVFGLPLDDNLGYSEEDKALARTVMTYWTNFAKTGDPNNPVKAPGPWETYSKETGTFLSLNTTLTTKQRYRRASCDFVNAPRTDAKAPREEL